MFNYRDLKLSIYCFEAITGLFLLFASYFMFGQTTAAESPLVYVLPAMILLVSGCVCLLFALDTYLLREDPDIWR